MIVSSAVALGFMVFFAGNVRELFQTPKELIVQFPQGRSEGLNPGSEVRFAGAKVGIVTGADINQNNQVELTIRVSDAVAIRTNSTATIKTIGLLGGEKYLDISTGSPQAPLLKAGDIIIGEEGLAMDELIHTVSQIAQNTRRITATVDQFLAGGDQPGEFVITLHKTQQLLDKAHQTVSDVDRLVNTNEKSIQDLVGQASRIIAQVNTLVANNRGKIDTTFTHINTITAQLPEVLAQMRSVLMNIREITGRLKEGEGTAARLIREDELHLQIQKLLDDMDALINHIKTQGVRVRIF